MATLIGNNKPSMMAFPSALNRMGTFPIDISSVWYSYEDAVAYATQTNFEPTYKDQTGLPYVGQILTVVETAEDGTTSVTAYSIQNEAGELAQVGTVTLGDNATIVRDEETGALSLYGVDSLTWKDAEGGAVTTYQPKLVKNAEGKVTLTWEIPSATTVEGLDSRLKTVEGNLTTAEGNITKNTGDIAANGEAIEAIEKDLADNYYNKKDIDTKITSVFKFNGTVTYLDKLPTSKMVTGDVYLVTYDVEETNYVDGTTPVANIEYVWTGTAWEPLGDDLIDLSNYYTKNQVDNITKTLVKTVENGTTAWTVKVTLADGTTVTEPVVKTVNASNGAFGLVKGDGVNVSIADGVITVHKAAHAGSADFVAKAGHAGSADYATEAGKVTNKLSIKIAEGEGNTVEFNGSKAESVDLSVYAKSKDLDNYYTKVEADNNFMSEEETNAKIKPVTDDIAALKGEGYGETVEGEAIAPTLMGLYNKDKIQDQNLETLNMDVNYLSNTILPGYDDRIKEAAKNASDAKTASGNAVAAAQGAVTAANAAQAAANQASLDAGGAQQQAEEAKEQAENAVDKATGAERVVEEVKGIVEEAKATANEAKAAAGVNAAAITALQTKDTEFTESIKALNAADLKHTEDIAKNAADIAGHTGILTSHGERLSTVEGKVSTLEGTITGLEGAMHFVGETEVNPESNNPVTIEGIENYQPKAGDVVLYKGLEFVYSKANTWVKFGDEGSYLTKTAADTNFLKKEDAATTYAPKSGFETLRDVTVPAAAKTAEWASVSGKPNLSYVEAKETTFSGTTTLTAEEGKIRNIEVYDADGERVILDIKRTSDLSYTLTAVGTTETLTVTYEVIHTVA